jgi:hypothetical protein
MPIFTEQFVRINRVTAVRAIPLSPAQGLCLFSVVVPPSRPRPRRQLAIDVVCQVEERRTEKSKWREFRSYHPKNGRGRRRVEHATGLSRQFFNL